MVEKDLDFETALADAGTHQNTNFGKAVVAELRRLRDRVEELEGQHAHLDERVERLELEDEPEEE